MTCIDLLRLVLERILLAHNSIMEIHSHGIDLMEGTTKITEDTSNAHTHQPGLTATHQDIPQTQRCKNFIDASDKLALLLKESTKSGDINSLEFSSLAIPIINTTLSKNDCKDTEMKLLAQASGNLY